MRNIARCATGHDRPESAVTIAGIRTKLRRAELHQPIARFCLTGLNRAVVVVERDVPLTGMNADVQRSRNFEFPVCFVHQHADWEFLATHMETLACDFAGISIHNRRELEQLGREPNRLFTVFFVNRRLATQLLEIPGVGLLPKISAITQNDAGHLGQPRCQIGFELAVLLVDGRELARMGQRLTGESAEVAILAHLGVVDEALAADPGKQCLGLRGGWITTESVADLHTVIMYSITLRRKYGNY